MDTKESLRQQVSRLTNLATLPSSVRTVGSMIESGTASAADFAEEIGKDQVLSAKVLRLVNSGFCGFRSPVNTISHATVLLGIDSLRMLLYGTTVFDLADSARMHGLWRHSLGTARASGVLAERLELPKHEELAVAGLLHDIGKIVITQVAPEKARAIRDLVDRSGGLQIDAEREVLGVTHLDVGGWLAQQWSLPPRLTAPVIFHNDFDPDREHAERIAVVHLADIVCRARGYGSPGDNRIPTIDRRAWQLLGVSMTDMAAMLVEVDKLDSGVMS
jgi:putative nucleotidyltransferase with HDIG domain